MLRGYKVLSVRWFCLQNLTHSTDSYLKMFYSWIVVALTLSTVLAQESPAQAPSDDLGLERLMNATVQTATLRKQSLQDAPASVTVVTAEDIRRYGYRTLAEVLSGVRSFYSNSDGSFTFVGTRGFSLLGDLNTRFLVLINGHQLTDNVYSAMYYFGDDFPLDLQLVDQIEIVRGPSSALYGSNGIFATINLITKSPSNAPRTSVSTLAGTHGEQTASLMTSFSLGREANVLLSLSGSNALGRTVDFPERAEAGLFPSAIGHVGEAKGYKLFAELTWRNWSVTALLGQHKFIAPTGWYRAEVGNTGTTDLESRNFIEAAWSRPLGENTTIRWRAYYDQYRYDGVFNYGGGSTNFDGALGDWVGSQFVFNHATKRLGTLTLGGEVNADLQNLQYNVDVLDTSNGVTRTENFRLRYPRKSLGVFAQQELTLSSHWTAILGVRLDNTSYDPSALSPRLALVYKEGTTTYKFLYGRAFRNPSTFERYWEPNPALQAERIDTFEFAREQLLKKRVKLITTAFHYRLGDMIVGVPVSDDTLQYRNASKATATGAEFEVEGHPSEWLETAVSFTMQRTRGINSTAHVENSPGRLAQFRASIPLPGKRIFIAGAVRYVGSRLTAYSESAPRATIADLTFTAHRPQSGLQLQMGVRNLLNTAYSDPLSPEHATRLMPASGRTLFVRLTWRDD